MMFWSTLNAFAALNCFAAGIPVIGFLNLGIAVGLLAYDVVREVKRLRTE